MAELSVRLHPAAAEDAQVARLWYFARSARASEDFLAEFDAAIASISRAPERWPRLHGPYRRFLLHKFPFSVVYVQRVEFIEVIAVAHHRRRPGYWSRRRESRPLTR